MSHEFSDNSAYDENWILLEGLDEEMSGEILGRNQEAFREALTVRSDVIDKSTAIPDNELFATVLNRVHEQAAGSFEKYLRTLFDVSMGDDIRRKLIINAFIEADISQKN